MVSCQCPLSHLHPVYNVNQVLVYSVLAILESMECLSLLESLACTLPVLVSVRLHLPNLLSVS